MSIEVKNVTKTYQNQKALNAVSFSIEKGEIVGFLGPNGAGKSTMMKILTGYISDFDGEALLCGNSIKEQPIVAQKLIGYLPEHNPLYVDMYVREYLQFNATIHKIQKSKIAEVIETVGLAPEAHKQIKQLSKGYRQRVGLAAALLHDPEILILDEPTTGLDPNQLLEIRTLIKSLGKDKTILFSTHIMQEVEAVCDRVILLKKGEIVADKKLSEIKTSSKQLIEVQFDLRIEPQFIKKLPNVVSAINTYENVWEITFETTEDMRPKVFDFAQQNGLKILQLNAKNTDLEAVFRALTH